MEFLTSTDLYQFVTPGQYAHGLFSGQKQLYSSHSVMSQGLINVLVCL